jgi:hypothetical protein
MFLLYEVRPSPINPTNSNVSEINKRRYSYSKFKGRAHAGCDHEFWALLSTKYFLSIKQKYQFDTPCMRRFVY